MVQTHSTTGLMAMVSSILFASVNGHMIMKTPYPYGASSLNNSPLDASGSDFPCKQRTGVYDAATQANNFAIGETQTLSFTGSAVHGGGSCQLSLSTDKEPTASSKWQVIHSIEGGCPATADGNLSGNDATTFDFTIPEGIATGDYTFAWTWFNKIGNREMYMNCAPITVTAAKKKRYAPSPPTSKRATTFPDMAVANLANINSCTTEGVEGSAVSFADPGDSVVVGTDTFKGFQGTDCPFAGGSTNPSASGSSGSGSSAASSAATAASSASAVSSATSTSAIVQTTGGSFASGTASVSASAASATAASSAPAVSSVASAVSSAAPAVSSSASSSSNSSGSATAGAACSDEGSTVCASGGQSYQICASGYWQTMPVAAGTSCTGTGVSKSLNIVATKEKKNKRHIRNHMRRHSGHA